MKKLMVLAAVAAMALGAKAELTCNLKFVRFKPAAGDTSPAEENLTQKGYYQCYIIQYSGQQSIGDYVKANTMASIAQQSLTTFNNDYSGNMIISDWYSLAGRAAKNGKRGDVPVPEGFDPANAYAVVYYLGGEETPSEYLALSNLGLEERMEYMQVSESWQTYTGPQPGPVPEPTSGLLLLLGMAGLALKRKLNG